MGFAEERLIANDGTETFEMGRYGDIDYPRAAKSGVLLGLTLLFVGEAGGYASSYVAMPGWEETLFFDLAVVGLLVFVVSPVLFGLVLPLTE